MAAQPLKVYDVKLGSTTVQMKLSEEDARRRGVWQEPEPVAKRAPARRRAPAKNKMATVETEATGGE